jgi:hypothetical protein
MVGCLVYQKVRPGQHLSDDAPLDGVTNGLADRRLLGFRAEMRTAITASALDDVERILDVARSTRSLGAR